MFAILKEIASTKGPDSLKPPLLRTTVKKPRRLVYAGDAHDVLDDATKWRV
jgi:hypothetical protein